MRTDLDSWENPCKCGKCIPANPDSPGGCLYDTVPLACSCISFPGISRHDDTCHKSEFYSVKSKKNISLKSVVPHTPWKCGNKDEDCRRAWCADHHNLLFLCKVCNQAESELEPSCPGSALEDWEQIHKDWVWSHDACKRCHGEDLSIDCICGPEPCCGCGDTSSNLGEKSLCGKCSQD